MHAPYTTIYVGAQRGTGTQFEVKKIDPKLGTSKNGLIANQLILNADSICTVRLYMTPRQLFVLAPKVRLICNLG